MKEYKARIADKILAEKLDAMGGCFELDMRTIRMQGKCLSGIGGCVFANAGCPSANAAFPSATGG